MHPSSINFLGLAPNPQDATPLLDPAAQDVETMSLSESSVVGLYTWGESQLFNSNPFPTEFLPTPDQSVFNPSHSPSGSSSPVVSSVSSSSERIINTLSLANHYPQRPALEHYLTTPERHEQLFFSNIPLEPMEFEPYPNDPLGCELADLSQEDDHLAADMLRHSIEVDSKYDLDLVQSHPEIHCRSPSVSTSSTLSIAATYDSDGDNDHDHDPSLYDPGIERTRRQLKSTIRRVVKEQCRTNTRVLKKPRMRRRGTSKGSSSLSPEESDRPAKKAKLESESAAVFE